LQKYRNKNNISEIENELKNYNSKTCNLEKFKTYILNKNRINKILFEEYKWYGYINRKKAYVNLIREIKK